MELEARGFARSAAELGRVVVAVRDGRPIYVEDVARVTDGPEPEPAVVLTASKERPGVRAGGEHRRREAARHERDRARRDASLAKVDALRGGLIPASVEATVTRNYGETAGEKSNELIEHLLIATLSVIALILVAMGWRSALVVAIAVPVTLALTLLLTYLNGYTLNRVTLFALIFSIGILVDDAIVVVENIHRHLYLPGPRRSFARVVLDAVDEVGNPTILATVAVIAAILPMALVRGLMGPYMRPIPVGASVAMLFSLVIAFVVSPWAAMKIFRKEAHLPETDASGLHPADPERDAPEPARDLPSAHPETAPEGRLARLDRRVIRWLLGTGEGPGRLPRRGRACCSSAAVGAPLHRRGEGEDAAVRQQARAPGPARPAGRRRRARRRSRSASGSRAGSSPSRRWRASRSTPAWPRRSPSSAWSATASCARRRSRWTSR